ncbi:ImmA/IrrE family metallo-endopeptidase [Polyangium aurulentum]|uniref:ImmA/IrrE family metallo-endopeptidase n=1 Tax=Polyangium aurulentum TaxID=2567896 RepID=UPI00113C5FAA|nr:hypothetical protein [Polyangium aurulentum]UQA55661.1 hypothetical protein E8A73_030535 [Polyangium aurulentum]
MAPPSEALAQERILLGVDRDDDDVNGQPDAEQAVVPHSPDLYTLLPPQGGNRTIEARGDVVRILVDGRPFTSGPLPASAKRIELQAVRPGRAEVRAFGKTIIVSAVEVRALDGQGKLVDPVRSHASLERTPPERIDDAFAKTANPDAVRFVVVGLPDDLPASLRLLSRAPSGMLVDALGDAVLGSIPCPDGVPAGMACGSTRPIRAVPDEIDRDHPMVHDRSILAEVGGGLEVTSPSARKLGGLRVGGPRVSKLGPLVRYRGRLRVLLVRARPGGPPPIGGTDAGAIAIARAEAAQANALWGACGIHFGPPGELEAEVVDPPRPHLLALGCDQGLPASGGTVRVRVDGREITATLDRGILPGGASRVVGAAIAAAGFSVRISDNATIGAGAHGSSDVLVRRRDGSLATVEPPTSGPITTDATMTACIGRVDLEDGLQHFGDIDAIAGTVEERTLIKAFDDGDPATIEVLVVPSFGGGGRIGESFIGADGGAVRNVLIEDRAGIRADRASFALAHELGHVLLDDPGHPDDFGADTPTRLMDADAANPTAYGPRRLLVDECVRALRQSGPGAPAPIVSPWPLSPLVRQK